MWATCLLKLWKHQCVHSTCHRAVEAVVSASWYWGAVAMPGATIQHKCTLFQWFPARTHRQTGRLHTASHKQTDMHAISIEDSSTGRKMCLVTWACSVYHTSRQSWNLSIYTQVWKTHYFKVLVLIWFMLIMIRYIIINWPRVSKISKMISTSTS